ncbi:MAG: phosphoglycerate mutase family protein [Gammaproteobacteria bacterium]
MANLKKDHRGLRRRPLYTPLAFVIVSLLAVVLIVAWLVLSWGSTMVVLVRHAERLPEGPDPGLTVVGETNAQRLAEMLERAGISAIYVTEARRTQDTAAPVAAMTGVEPREIPADKHKRLLRRLKWRHRNDVVFVVGHSNTVPVIAAGLGAEVGFVDAEDYAGLWVISYSRLRGTRLLMLRY